MEGKSPALSKRRARRRVIGGTNGGALHSACRVERVPDRRLGARFLVCHTRDAPEPVPRLFACHSPGSRG